MHPRSFSFSFLTAASRHQQNSNLFLFRSKCKRKKVTIVSPQEFICPSDDVLCLCLQTLMVLVQYYQIQHLYYITSIPGSSTWAGTAESATDQTSLLASGYSICTQAVNLAMKETKYYIHRFYMAKKNILMHQRLERYIGYIPQISLVAFAPLIQYMNEMRVPLLTAFIVLLSMNLNELIKLKKYFSSLLTSRYVSSSSQ